MHTRTYFSVDEMWMDTLHDLKSRGKSVPSRDGDSVELLGYHAALMNPAQNFVLHPERKLDPTYAAAELLWYLSGTNKIDMIKAYAPQYERFANDGVAHGAYGHRWYYDPGMRDARQEAYLNAPKSHSQIGTVVELLKAKPNTRQAIVSMWNGGDLLHATWGKKNDLPCTLNFQFLLRDNLTMITTMRSNDVWLGLPYDVWAFTCIQRLIADKLQVKCGPYIHNVGSMHYYKRDEEKIDRVLKYGSVHYSDQPTTHNWRQQGWDAGFSLEIALDTERHARTGEKQPMSILETWTHNNGENDDQSMMNDLTYACVCKTQKWRGQYFHSPILKKAWEQKYGDPAATVR